MTKPAEVKRGVRWLYYLLFLIIFMDYFDEIQGKVPFASNNELFLVAILYLLQLGLYSSVSNGKNWARVVSVSINLLFIAFLSLIFYSTGYNLVGTTYSFASITGLSGFYQDNELAAGAYIVCFIIILMNSTVPLLSRNAANWFKGSPMVAPLKEYATKPQTAKKTSISKASKPKKAVIKKDIPNLYPTSKPKIEPINDDDLVSSETLDFIGELGFPVAELMYQDAVSFLSDDDGSPVDLEKAFSFALKSADMGYDEAKVLVGTMYLVGDGTPKNINTGIGWLNKAAKSSNTKVSSRAKHMLEQI